SGSLLTYWQDGFPPRTLQAVPWLVRETLALAQYLFAPEQAWQATIIGMAVLLGIWRSWQRRQYRFALIAGSGPVLLVMLASFVHMYPYDGQTGGRVLL